MLFRYLQLKDRFQTTISGWMAAYEEIEPAMNLYFASKSGAHPFIDGKFLSLAQCLETYHRRSSSQLEMPEEEYSSLLSSLLVACEPKWKSLIEGKLKFENELSLRKRLKKVLEPVSSYFGDEKSITYLINKIVDTRNYLTHYPEELESKTADDQELRKLCLKMEAIFQMHLLSRIGITQEEISTIVKNNRQLRYKLNMDYGN